MNPFADPQAMALFGMSQGLLGASNPSRVPIGMGGALAQGMGGALQGYSTGLQFQDRQWALDAAKQRQLGLEQYAATLPPQLRQAFMLNPEGFLKPQKLGPGESLMLGGHSIAELPATPSLVQVPVPDQPGVTQPTWLRPGQATGTAVGGPAMPEILNPAVQDARKNIAAAGKPDVNVTVPVQVGASLAGKVGDIAQGGRDAAAGAVDVVNTVQRVGAAIEHGNVNVGPTATIRTKSDQFAQVLGIGGQSTGERLVNTRNVIRGLAQFTVGARKALKGQGQVSDYEGRLLKQAESGEIDDFTLPELKDFLKVTESLARKVHAEHKRVLGVMSNSKDEAVRSLVPYFDIADLPKTPAAPPQPKPRRYNPATGKIE